MRRFGGRQPLDCRQHEVSQTELPKPMVGTQTANRMLGVRSIRCHDLMGVIAAEADDNEIGTERGGRDY